MGRKQDTNPLLLPDDASGSFEPLHGRLATTSSSDMSIQQSQGSPSDGQRDRTATIPRDLKGLRVSAEVIEDLFSMYVAETLFPPCPRIANNLFHLVNSLSTDISSNTHHYYRYSTLTFTQMITTRGLLSYSGAY
jgi:hypothetical protein